MTYQDYLNMDLSQFLNMNEKELRNATRTLANVTNKRYGNIKKSDIQQTPASFELEKSGGVIKTRGKNVNQLRSEFIRAKNFLMNKTSSVTGYRKIRNQTIDSLDKRGIHITPDQYQKFWEAYERVKNADFMAGLDEFKYKILENIEENLTNGHEDTLVEDAINKMNELYKESVSGDEDYEGFWNTIFGEQR